MTCQTHLFTIPAWILSLAYDSISVIGWHWVTILKKYLCWRPKITIMWRGSPKWPNKLYFLSDTSSLKHTHWGFLIDTSSLTLPHWCFLTDTSSLSLPHWASSLILPNWHFLTGVSSLTLPHWYFLTDYLTHSVSIFTSILYLLYSTKICRDTAIFEEP